ncbi:DUF2971 domain-containing protein [Desulfosporosinus sp. BG]|uniref:DUF2971 domain-containing protein n=1 Tax=Desulfosporosinus sp. BG TaxID=1633135 RepID=UPI0008591A28|nr:DUF2971 domain-containing protein [Desulfosporosinus sp. BG]ODA42711.1 hypothetical protein DSBG_0585 [Desulfosporosinus sp. BG]
MAQFDYEAWKDRIANRTDITGMVTHLTKPKDITLTTKDENEINFRAVDSLINILKERKIYGSTTQSGFIIGNTPAVCFQDVPFYGLIQNVEYEKELRMTDKSHKIRYCGVGLVFSKFYIFGKGGRPVFYEQTEKAKKILPENEYWRVVNYQVLTGNSKIIDWTHEREWRVPGDIEFELSLPHIVLYDKACWDYFNDMCPEDIIQQVYGTTILKSLLM